MALFPIPHLERSVAVFEPELQRTETIRPQRKASLTELEQMVKDFKKDRDYSSTTHVLDKMDGLKPRRSHVDECIESESAAMERHENIRKIPEGIPPPMFRPITVNNVEHELNYIYKYGIEKFINNYMHRSCEGLTCLRDSRYLNAQLLFLQENE